MDDPVLNRWVDGALRQSYSLAAIWARLSTAHAAARALHGEGLPSLTGSAGLTFEHRQGRGVGAGGDGTFDASTASNAAWAMGIAASYEVDLWGSRRAAHKEALETVAAASFDVETVAISLVAEIGIAWYRWLEGDLQTQLRRAQVETHRQVLTVVEARYSRGQVSAQDVFRQRQIIVAAEHAVVAAAAERRRWRARLAALLSRSPDALTMPKDAALPASRPLPHLGTPVGVVRRRPDLQAALRRLAAADARVAIAVARRYPTLSISASAHTSASSAADLVQNWLAAFASNLVGPIWDFGARKAQAEGARAAANEAWFGYAQAAVNAVMEVEDALARDDELRREAISIGQQLRLSQRALEVARGGYAAGRASYLQVLDAIQTLQELERRSLQAKRLALEARIALHRAIAGPIGAPTNEQLAPSLQSGRTTNAN